MAQFLELSELAEENGVAEMKVRGGGIETGFDDERFAASQLFSEVLLGDKFGNPPPEEGNLLSSGGGRGG